MLELLIISLLIAHLWSTDTVVKIYFTGNKTIFIFKQITLVGYIIIWHYQYFPVVIMYIVCIYSILSIIVIAMPLVQGRIQDFKLGGGALKKIAPSGGRREHFWGISCENSRFYAKKADYRISLLPLTSNSKNKTVVSKLHCMSNL